MGPTNSEGGQGARDGEEETEAIGETTTDGEEHAHSSAEASLERKCADVVRGALLGMRALFDCVLLRRSTARSGSNSPLQVIG
jgi:hypothetical protein